MKSAAVQAGAALTLVFWGLWVLAGPGAALLGGGVLLYIDYAAERWRMP